MSDHAYEPFTTRDESQSCRHCHGTPSEHRTVIGPNPPPDGNQWDCQCARCGSSTDWLDCEECGGEGVDGHDCGDDCCCCLYPEDNVQCQFCRGECGWWKCLSSSPWCNANPLPGREDIPRGKVEWFRDDVGYDPNP